MLFARSLLAVALTAILSTALLGQTPNRRDGGIGPNLTRAARLLEDNAATDKVEAVLGTADVIEARERFGTLNGVTKLRVLVARPSTGGWIETHIPNRGWGNGDALLLLSANIDGWPRWIATYLIAPGSNGLAIRHPSDPGGTVFALLITPDRQSVAMAVTADLPSDPVIMGDWGIVAEAPVVIRGRLGRALQVRGGEPEQPLRHWSHNGQSLIPYPATESRPSDPFGFALGANDPFFPEDPGPGFIIGATDTKAGQPARCVGRLLQ
jgi:hypothetical protein